MSKDEVGAFFESIINDKDSIVAVAFGKMSDEVGSGTFPGRIRNGDWDEFAWGRFEKGFCSGTEVTSSYIVGNKSVHVGPPIVVRDKILGAPVTGIASDGRVMVKLQDFKFKEGFLGDVDFSVIENQSAFFKQFIGVKMFQARTQFSDVFSYRFVIVSGLVNL